MLAAYAARLCPDDPLAGLEVGQRPDPAEPEGWSQVRVRAAAVNHHDLFALRGVGLTAESLPMVLGSDAAGTDAQGRDVVVHAVVSSPGWLGDETLDPRRSLLSEKHQGTLAERVVVPSANLVPKPPELSFTDAACLPVAWLTAYRMLFTRARLQPGQTVLVQGAGGGVSTALVVLGAAAGLRVWVTSRDTARGERAVALGAEASFDSGARLPDRVDAVMESVGRATWRHSVRSVRPGGTIVVCGATSGAVADTELNRVFFLQLRILGSTMGTRAELEQLMAFLVRTGLRPVVDRVLPLSEARAGFAALEAGEVYGKVVLTP